MRTFSEVARIVQGRTSRHRRNDRLGRNNRIKHNESGVYYMPAFSLPVNRLRPYLLSEEQVRAFLVRPKLNVTLALHERITPRKRTIFAAPLYAGSCRVATEGEITYRLLKRGRGVRPRPPTNNCWRVFAWNVVFCFGRAGRPRPADGEPPLASRRCPYLLSAEQVGADALVRPQTKRKGTWLRHFELSRETSYRPMTKK